MSILRPKCRSKNDEFSLKYIEQHVGPSAYLDKRTCE